MIQKLLIKNFAIIDEVEINFSKKLTIITGETGAGKSILLGGLGLIMGNRADHVSLYNPNEKCVIEAYFDISHYNIKDFFDENELDYDQQIIVRREINTQGKSRAFINDTPVNLKVLQQLSAALIDLHQQFDTLDIHNVSFQLRMIDALAGNKDILNEYQQKYKAFQADKRKLSDLIAQNDQAAKEIDFLNYQLAEFNKAELMEGEQEKLEAEQASLQNAEEIKRHSGAAFNHLSESEHSVVSQLQAVAYSLNTIKKYSKNIAKTHERLENLIEELQDVADECENIGEMTEFNPSRIGEIEERLNIIYKLQKKHNALSVNDLMDIQTGIEQRLQMFGDLSETIATLEKSIEQQEKHLNAIAATLSEKRQAVIPSFEDKVHTQLGLMAMEYAKLKVNVQPLQDLNATGKDEVEFLFAPNKGSKFLPIKDVASGGELSRLTLVTKSLVASSIPLPTLIFDEIDTGISGDVALRMGSLLRDLSNQHQVVSITHSPQIASKAEMHYFVFKKVLEDRTVTNVRPLNDEERVRALAVMLSSNPPTASAMENARELLASA